MRIWFDIILKKNLKLCIDWSKIDKHSHLNAMKYSFVDIGEIFALIKYLNRLHV